MENEARVDKQTDALRIRRALLKAGVRGHGQREALVDAIVEELWGGPAKELPTSCSKGHTGLTADDWYVYPRSGQVVCRVCRRVYQRELMRKVRARA